MKTLHASVCQMIDGAMGCKQRLLTLVRQWVANKTFNMSVLCRPCRNSFSKGYTLQKSNTMKYLECSALFFFTFQKIGELCFTDHVLTSEICKIFPVPTWATCPLYIYVCERVDMMTIDSDMKPKLSILSV